MIKKSFILLSAALIGLISYIALFGNNAQGDAQTPIAPVEVDGELPQTAIFAGGCFWCVESDFDKVRGVIATTSGYTGGTLQNPTYEDVTYKDTGHYEAVAVEYYASIVSYEELVDYFFRHVDPTDDGGQFCDRGRSYRTAIFAKAGAETDTAYSIKSKLESTANLPGPIVTPILPVSDFWPAEDYHQDYYTKNPIRYRYYRHSCGRDARVKKVWKNAPDGGGEPG